MGKLSKRLQKKMWSIHNWVGLYAGVVIAVLSITGVVALFKVEIDRLVNHDYFYIQSETKMTDQKADISPVIDSLKQVYGNENFVLLVTPRKEHENLIVNILERKSLLDFKAWEFFVNPYTAKIVGKRDNFRSISYFIRNLHVRLYDGLFGRYIVGLAGIALLISTITGFWIYGNFMKKQWFATIRKKNLRITMADYHKLIGITTLVFNLMIAITGAWIGLQGLLQQPIVGDRPGIYKAEEMQYSKEEDVTMAFDYLEAYAASRSIFPELEPHSFAPSTDGSGVITVRGDVPRTAFERHHFQLTLDKKTLEEVHRLDIREQSLGAKLFYIQESIHFGDWGGIILKMVYAFFGITSGFLALTGFVVYLKRTENKRKDKPKFVELKPLLLRWTYGILTIILLLMVLALSFGVAVPSLLVIICVYGTLIFLLLRTLFLFVKRKIISKRLLTN
ncbi:MAG: PepSY-associated TM helix domain-containing protein [Bacteroidota bacterium]